MKIPKILLFNVFTNAFIKQADYMPFITRRLHSMGTEFIFVMGVFYPLLLILSIPAIILLSNYPLGIDSIQSFFVGLIPFSLIFFILINKDFYNGRSVAKRIFGYQVIDNKTNAVASELKCMFRNVTLLIWPLEGLISLIHPERRLGDLIAGTRLINTEKQNPETILDDINRKNSQESYNSLMMYSVLITLLLDIFCSIPFLFYK